MRFSRPHARSREKSARTCTSNSRPSWKQPGAKGAAAAVHDRPYYPASECPEWQVDHCHSPPGRTRERGPSCPEWEEAEESARHWGLDSSPGVVMLDAHGDDAVAYAVRGQAGCYDGIAAGHAAVGAVVVVGVARRAPDMGS